MNVETVLAERPTLRELQKRGTTTLCDTTTCVQVVTLFSLDTRNRSFQERLYGG
jgi:hypothetical protein